MRHWLRVLVPVLIAVVPPFLLWRMLSNLNAQTWNGFDWAVFRVAAVFAGWLRIDASRMTAANCQQLFEAGCAASLAAAAILFRIVSPKRS